MTSSSPRERMHVVVVGRVGHGKSTVIGRLLADTESLPSGMLERIRARCHQSGRPFDYAFLLDALRDERSEEAVIDVARVSLKSATREDIIIDAPGHCAFLKSMIEGAARAQAALVVVDASEWTREEPQQCVTMLSLLGTRQVAVLINKMDLVGWSEATFRAIEGQYRASLEKLGIRASWILPTAGRDGDFIATGSRHAPWYDGPTVRQILDRFTLAPQSVRAPLRISVQGVYEFTGNGDDRHIVKGTVVSGSLGVGDELVFFPSREQSHVRSIIEDSGREPSRQFTSGSTTSFTLTEKIHATRGEVATRATDPPPEVASRLRASVFWMGKSPLSPGETYGLCLGTARVPVRMARVEAILHAETLASAHRDRVERHEVADCTLVLEQPVACDADRGAETSRFVIVDDQEICGGGVVCEVLAGDPPSLAAPLRSGPQSTAKSAGACVIWFTGLSGAGKTTLARAVARLLEAGGRPIELLDGDALRDVMPTGFSRAEREAHVRRVGFFASRLEAHGITTIASLISPYRDSREQVRRLCHRFIEVYLSTPLSVCERRDPKGLYARARAGTLRGFTGIDDPYEAPTAPDLAIDTSRQSVDDAARSVLEFLNCKVTQWPG